MSSEPNRRRWTAWTLAGVLFLLAMGSLAGEFTIREVMGKTKDWESTDGLVTRSGVKEQAGERFADGSTIETRYAADVHYRYTVGDETHDEHGIALTERWTTDRREAQAVASAYPKGSTAKIYYDPSHPSSAVLDRGVGGWVSAVLGWVSGLSLLGASVALLRVVRG